MSSDLFSEVVEPRRTTSASRLSALPLSIFAHGLVLAALVVTPLLATDVLPLVAGNSEIVMPVISAPTPPTVPAPTPRRPQIPELANPDAAPTVAPNGVGRELLIRTDPPPDLAASPGNGEVPGLETMGVQGIVETAPPPPPRPATPVRVSVSKAPTKIRDVSPVYPTIAIASHTEGTVIIEAVIGVTGDVIEAKVLRSKPLLDEAALTAVRQWRYTPTLLNGVPVPVILTVTVTFALK